jgi:hypothetical protein
MAALIIVAVVIIMAMITNKSQDRALFYTCELVRKMPQFSYARRHEASQMCSGMGDNGGGGGEPAYVTEKILRVRYAYDYSGKADL